MTIEQQVTNLELSKKLKALGVKQKSLWYWTDKGLKRCEAWDKDDERILCSAFTVAELGEMLPAGSHSRRFKYKSVMWNCIVPYEDFEHGEAGDSEANARAKALIWLIEQGYAK